MVERQVRRVNKGCYHTFTKMPTQPQYSVELSRFAPAPKEGRFILRVVGTYEIYGGKSS